VVNVGNDGDVSDWLHKKYSEFGRKVTFIPSVYRILND
jgi:hypothetical protein